VKEQAKERARAKRLMDNYKLTSEKYDAIFIFQGGVCYVCQCPEPVKGRRLSVDHDHETGEIRGLACSRCNPLLGKIENAFKRYGLGKVPGLTVAIVVGRLHHYLESPPARIALGYKHIGYCGRTGTKTHRAHLRKEKRSMTPSALLMTRKRG
jgi:hypothetical protein